MSETIIASAVTMPDTEPAARPSSAHGLKRRQSEISEQENKRQRISPGKNSPTAAASSSSSSPSQTRDKRDTPRDSKLDDSRDSRRKSGGVGDEKQRSKRLFGALLGNLNQPSDRASKRRQEIESRRKAELQRQDDERLEDKQRRLDAVREHRRKAQEEVDEENMRIRHKNMLDAANFLQTNCEPKLYYRPWDLRPDEEDRIEDQIKDAQAQIDKELEEFEARKRGEPLHEGQTDGVHTENVEKGSSPGTEEVDGVEPRAVAKDQKQTPEHQAQDLEKVVLAKPDADAEEARLEDVPDNKSEKQENDEKQQQNAGQLDGEEKQQDMDDEGDHVVEGDEDTVIY